MSVRIQVAADAQQVISAFDKINDAIRKTGQEGKRFGDLDFNHPELRDLEADLRRVQERFAGLEKMGRGATPGAVRKMAVGADPAAWFAAQGNFYPDAGARANHQATVGNYIFNGTQFAPTGAPPAPPGPAPAPGGFPSGRRRRLGSNPDDDDRDDEGDDDDDDDKGGGKAGGYARGATRHLAGMGKQAFGGLLAYAGLQGIAGTITHSLNSSTDEATGADAFFRTLALGADDFNQLRQSVRDASMGLGITYVQTERLAGTWEKLTNQMSSATVLSGVSFGAGAARGYGVDPAVFIKGMAEAAAVSADRDMRGGKRFDPKEFALLVGSTAAASGQGAQIEQVMQTLVEWTKSSTSRLVDHDTTAAFAAQYAALAGNNSALRGAAGVQVLSSLDRSISGGGGGGMAGQLLTYRALAAKGITDPWQQQWQLEGGAFESLGKDGGTNWSAVRAEIHREYGTGTRAWEAMGNYGGITAHQAKALDQAPQADVNKALALLQANGLDLSKINETSINDIIKVSGASDGGLDDYASHMLKTRKDLSADETKALGADHGEQLRNDIVKALAAHGMEKTDATIIQDAAVTLEDKLTELGQTLTKPMLLLKDGVIGLTGGIAGLANILTGGNDPSADFGSAAGGGPATPRPRDTSRGWTRLGHDIKNFMGAVNGAPDPDGPDSPLRDSFISATAQQESGGGTNLGDPNHAWGLYGFEPGTFTGLIEDAEKNGDRTVISRMSQPDITDRNSILKLRNDKAFATHMLRLYENSRIIPALKKAKVPISNLSMYAGWHFGEGAGPRIMQAPDDAPMSAYLSDAAIAGNRAEAGMTVGDWRKAMGHRFSPTPINGMMVPDDVAGSGAGGAAAGGAGMALQGGSVTVHVVDAKSGRKIGTGQAPVTVVGKPKPGNAAVAPTQAVHPPDSSGAYHAMLADLGRGGMPAIATPGGF